MEFLDIPIFDNDLYKMIVRLIINTLFLYIIINFIYVNYTKKRQFVFTFYMISFIIFFLCFTLKKFELGLGMALGLFAIFGILRYRTRTIPIKDMTYLFIVIGISVINSLANSKMSYSEVFLTNFFLVTSIYILEKRANNNYESKIKKVSLKYPLKIDNIGNEELIQLIADDLKISKDELEVDEIDFSSKIVKLKLIKKNGGV